MSCESVATSAVVNASYPRLTRVMSGCSAMGASGARRCLSLIRTERRSGSARDDVAVETLGELLHDVSPELARAFADVAVPPALVPRFHDGILAETLELRRYD